MKAMILAAGKGTRVRPITNTIPKPMIPLLRKPLMESIVEHLRLHGIREIMVNTSWLASVIERYFGDGQQFGVDLGYSFEGRMEGDEIVGEALGSAGGMKKIQDFSGFFDETFIVVCGDAWIDLDIGKVYEFHKSRKAVATIVLKEVPHEETYKYGVVATDDDGRIRQFQEKPKPEDAVSNTINTGIYLFEPEVFDYIPSGKEYDIGGQLFPDLVARGLPFYGVNIPFQWVDIGSLPDLWDGTRDVLEGRIPGYPLPGKEIAPGIRAGINVRINLDKVQITPPVFIGSSSEIQDGAIIEGPTQIGANCVVESGAELRQCIIDDYTRVSGMTSLENKILFGDHCITPEGEAFDIKEMDIGFAVDDARKGLEMSEIHKLIFDLAEQAGRR
ncbi:MAG: NDP-sugar synthase [Gammaproteobacteria bacterium]|nr:NDP-sugar synthase [Gammaproteobacteria bacterium]MCP5136690.1 NDP-sugar synthase [Gammaproteobacteria bacterium]